MNKGINMGSKDPQTGIKGGIIIIIAKFQYINL